MRQARPQEIMQPNRAAIAGTQQDRGTSLSVPGEEEEEEKPDKVNICASLLDNLTYLHKQSPSIRLVNGG
jgi:hypothetical protein